MQKVNENTTKQEPRQFISTTHHRGCIGPSASYRLLFCFILLEDGEPSKFLNELLLCFLLAQLPFVKMLTHENIRKRKTSVQDVTSCRKLIFEAHNQSNFDGAAN